MKVEIIAVGSELLLGQITNTNATFMSKRFAEIGVNMYYHTVVGDNPQRLKEAISVAEKRSNVLIFSGGLGPTKDDITKEVIAKHVGTDLIMNEEALTAIQSYFEKSKRQMTVNNEKQALVLSGSTVLTNKTGMAPGMALKKNGRYYILLPGPPHELEPMFVDEVIPYLLKENGKQEMITSKVLKFFGIGEAELEYRIQSILEQQSNPTIAPLSTADGVTLRITAKAATIEQANQLISPVEQNIRTLVGDYIYGTDKDTLSSKALQLLEENSYTIAAAESLTAGLLMGKFANEAGISSTLYGGVVVYNEVAKEEQLGISANLLKNYGIVSSHCAEALAIKVRERFRTNVGIGITGAAGPTPHDGEPAGTVWIGIAIGEQSLKSYKLLLSGDRNSNRERTVQFALYYLIKQLQNM